MGNRNVYEPSPELEVEAHTHILGGVGNSVMSHDESREDRRRRVLEATMSRLRKDEEELEQSCGTRRAVRHSDGLDIRRVRPTVTPPATV